MERDSILISNTLRGDMNSFSILVMQYRQGLYNFLLKMTMSKEDAEDMLQEVFVRAYNNLYKYNSLWKFSTWIFRIALNVFRSEYKKKKKMWCINNTGLNLELPCSLNDHPEIAFETKENRLLIIKMICGLKKEQKVALILKHVQGFSYDEIGKILDITPEAAKMRVQRAKQILCSRFDDYEKRCFK